MRRCEYLLILTLLFIPVAQTAHAKPNVVASFSILGDMVRQIAGDRVELAVLVGPDADAHVYEPTPADAKTLAKADLVVVNGLNFEGFIDRLITKSGFKGQTVVASQGVEPRLVDDDDHHGHSHKSKDHKHGKIPDPHAWQDLKNGKIYAQNIRDALVAQDPAGKDLYMTNTQKFLDQIDTLDAAVREKLAAIPQEKRRILTSHDAFGYFAKAYGIEILAVQGVNTEAEASAKDVAKIIRQIKQQNIRAVFVENIADKRLVERITRETGAVLGGALYSDALSKPAGEAPTYLDMVRVNLDRLAAAMTQ